MVVEGISMHADWCISSNQNLWLDSLARLRTRVLNSLVHVLNLDRSWGSLVRVALRAIAARISPKLKLWRESELTRPTLSSPSPPRPSFPVL